MALKDFVITHPGIEHLEALAESAVPGQELMVMHAAVHTYAQAMVNERGRFVYRRTSLLSHSGLRTVENRWETHPIAVNPWGICRNYVLGQINITHREGLGEEALPEYDRNDFYIAEHNMPAGRPARIPAVLVKWLWQSEYGQLKTPQTEYYYRSNLRHFANMFLKTASAANFEFFQFETPVDVPEINVLPHNR